MTKSNFNKIPSDKKLVNGKRKYFLGDILLSDISKNIGVTDQKIYFAGFKNGAKTKIHFHQGPQTLVVTHGKGVLVLYKNRKLGTYVKLRQKTSQGLKPGDVVFVPAKTLHWHGAIEGSNLGHLAFNGFTSERKEAETIWYDSDFRSYAKKIF